MPLTQHQKIWEFLFPWIENLKNPKIAKHYFFRFMKLKEEIKEDFIEYLIKHGEYSQAFKYIIELINDQTFVSVKGKS